MTVHLAGSTSTFEPSRTSIFAFIAVPRDRNTKKCCREHDMRKLVVKVADLSSESPWEWGCLRRTESGWGTRTRSLKSCQHILMVILLQTLESNGCCWDASCKGKKHTRKFEMTTASGRATRDKADSTANSLSTSYLQSKRKGGDTPVGCRMCSSLQRTRTCRCRCAMCRRCLGTWPK